MANFTVRLLLLDASYDNFLNIHLAMKNAKFKTTILDSNNGKEYHMPAAEYTFEGDYNKLQVIDLIKKITEANNIKCEIFVTECISNEDRAFLGLRVVKNINL